MAVWIPCNRLDVVVAAVLVLALAFVRECFIAVIVCLRICRLFFSYLAVESDFCECCLFMTGEWMMVHVGVWSVRGGDIMPAVMLCSVAVVSVTSMRVAVCLWTGSCRVGSMMVVCRLFSRRKK